MQNPSKDEGQKIIMSSGRVVLPSSVGGTVELSFETPLDFAPDVEELTAKELRIQEGVEELQHPAWMGSSAG